jgi:hypothetical protein
MRFRLTLALVCLLVSAAAASDCFHGSGQFERSLPGGYQAIVGQANDKPDQCRGALLDPSGKPDFEVTAPEVSFDPASLQDLNGDGKLEIVFDTVNDGEYSIWILTPGANPALIRQISNRRPFTFDDRDGDGKFEIWTRDTAFDGIDGLPSDMSPFPYVVFQLYGSRLVNVSNLPAFWSEYKRELDLANGRAPKGTLDELTREKESMSGKPEQDSPADLQKKTLARSVILELAVDYMYAGHGTELWKTLQDYWPYNDRDRIRQEILRRRMGSKLLREVARPSPQTTTTRSTTPASGPTAQN